MKIGSAYIIVKMCRALFLLLLALAGTTVITAAASGLATPNPKNVFKTAMAVYPNVWQSRNFYIGAYHYIQVIRLRYASHACTR
jgi:hypothetical protein